MLAPCLTYIYETDFTLADIKSLHPFAENVCHSVLQFHVILLSSFLLVLDPVIVVGIIIIIIIIIIIVVVIN
jgi:hypothetical protein